MIYLIKFFIIFIILNFSKIYAKDDDILNNKIIFKINNNIYTSIDIENRKNYLQLLNNTKIPNSENNEILNDYISGLIFVENFNKNKFKIDGFDNQIERIYEEKFYKYENLNNTEFKKINKEIINKNIKIDFIRQKTIEQILNSKRDEIFEETNELDLLYNFNIKYLTIKKEELININIENIKNKNDLTNLENQLRENKIKFIIKEQNINNIEKLSNELKLTIKKNKRIFTKIDNNLITIISIEKKFESYENIFVTLINVKLNKKIDNKNLNCNYINNIENKKFFKEYKYSTLNKQIKDNLFKVNDFILIKNNDILNYIFLCEMRFDKETLNTININKKIESLAKKIEDNFIKKYYKLYKVEIINE